MKHRAECRKDNCNVYIDKLSTGVFSSYGAPVSVVVSRIPKQILCHLIMEGYKRCYVQCRSGRLAGSLTHTVMPSCRNMPQKAKAIVNLDPCNENIEKFFLSNQCTVNIKNSRPVQEIFDVLTRPKLRRQEQLNYAELSLTVIDDDKSNERHVPIYNQVKHDQEKKQLPKSDLYEFDSDSENVRKKKRRKIRDSADNSVGFERDMKNIVQVIEKNFKKKRYQQQRRVRVAKTIQNIEKQFPNEEVEFVAQNAVTQDRVPRLVCFNENRALFDCTSVLRQTREKSDMPPPIIETVESESDLFGLTTLIKTKDTTTDSMKPIETNDDDDDHDHDDFLDFTNACPLQTTNSVRLIDNKESDLFNSSTLPFETKDETTDRQIIEDEADLFGFNTESSEPDSNRNKINVISNIILSPPNSVGNEDFHLPKANSTMFITTRKPKCLASPWRPDLGITRNPYILQFKGTLLPSYNQEMVLDSTILDKGSMDASRTPARQSRPQQTSILNYFNESKVETEIEVVKECSLFDNSDFSPIKSIKVHAEDKENVSPQKTSTAVKKIKRNILQTSPNRMPLLPLQNLTNQLFNSQEDVEQYFGFDSFTEEDKENIPDNRKKTPRSYFNRPVRLVDVIKPKIKNTLLVDSKSVVRSNPEPEENIPAEHLRLFEDLEDKTSIRKYVPKRMRRPRQPSIVSEYSDDENDHHKQRHKNIRTKKEEQEFERWAAAFNSMCQEVDEYTLEIE